MRSPLYSLALILCALASFAPRAFAGVEPIVTTDLLRIRQITSIDVSRDATRAVYAVKSIAEAAPEDEAAEKKPPEVSVEPGPAHAPAAAPHATGKGGKPEKPPLPKYEYRAHLFLLDLTAPDAQPRQLTFDKRNDSAPQLSPDGKRIAFVRGAETAAEHHPHGGAAAKNEGPRAQVWIIKVDGGEARQLTNFTHGCENPRWSPDGRRLLVSSSIPFDEMEGVPAWPADRPKRAWNDTQLPPGVEPDPAGSLAQIRAWLERTASEDNPAVINRLDFQDEQSLMGMMKFQHLFILDVTPETLAAADFKPITQEQSTSGTALRAVTLRSESGATRARRLTSGFFDHTQPAFMPDGQSVVYVAKKPTDRHPDRVLDTALWRVNLDGSNDRPILAMDGWRLGQPKPSPDGAVIAFSGERTDEPAFRQTQLGIISVTGNTASDPFWLIEETTFPAAVGDFEWNPAQPSAILFTTAMSGGFPLMTVSLGLVEPATIVGEEDGRPVGVNAFDIGGATIVFSQTSAANPCVLKVRGSPIAGVSAIGGPARGEARVAHDLNEWVSDKRLSMPVEDWITRPDGVRVQYWIMEPAVGGGREQGKKYPLCLEMHGGPAAMWGPGEFSMWHELQLLCSWGYGVVYANPRGSGGYGYEFQKRNYQDWGEGPAGDVLAAVDAAVLKEWVDRDKLVITGGSYAGYLTAWIIAHDNRFKAAVAQRGVYDLATFYGEGNAWRLVQWAFGGNPFDARAQQIIDRNSPFTYVTRIRTPLLILHASQDLRTGVSQSEMLYRALKEMDRPVEYVRYPNAGHDLSRTGDPLQRMDRLNRILEFFERYVQNPRAAPVAGR